MKNDVMYNHCSLFLLSPDTLPLFKNAYRYAVAEGFSAFVFNDHRVPVEHAKEMIDFLDNKLP